MNLNLRPSTRTTAARAWLAAVVVTLAAVIWPQLMITTASASPTTLSAVADATAKSASPDANFGTAYSLAAKSPSDTDPSTVISYVKFQVSGLPSTPTKVVLRINTYSANPGLQVWQTDNSWTETGLTYADAPVMSTLIGAMPDVSNNAWTELDVTSVVTGNGTYTFGFTSTRTTAKTFASRETGGTGPQLSVDTDPVSPSTSTASATASATTSATTSATADPPSAPTSTPASPTAISRYNVAADSYVRSDQPDAGFGAAYTLFTQSSGPEMRIYLRFTVTGLAGPVTGATLRLYSYSNSGDGIDVHAGDNAWTEAGLTWNTAPAPGVVVGSVKPLTLNAVAAADVTPAVTGNGTYTFVITTTRTTANKFASRESTANAPQLVVTTGDPSSTAPPSSPTDSGSASSPTSPTSSTSAPDPTIVAAGDIACPPGKTVSLTACQQKATSDLALSLHPSVVLPLGDDQYETGTSAEFSGGYAPTWGRMDTIARPVPGNHEWGYVGSSVEPTGAAGYFAYFGVKSHPLQPDCTTFCASWYSYDIGSWHVIALDSQCAAVGGCNPGNPEYQWLLSDLNSHQNTCTLAYWHIPLFSSSQDHQPDMRSIFQLLYNKGADVVLNGHAHFYERFAPQDALGNPDPARGIRELLVGTGGRNFFPIRPTPAANSEARIANTFGVLQMVLHETSYDWQFVPVAGSTATDQGSSSCH